MTREEIEALEGEALAVAVAEQVMGWEKSIIPTLATEQPEVWRGKRTRAVVYWIEDWRPDQNIAQAFEVMRARPEWTWDFTELNGDVKCGPVVRAYVSPGGSDCPILGRAEVEVLFRFWTRAWCTAICRSALKAVQTKGASE